MIGWRNGAVALVVVILAMCVGMPAFAGDTSVALQRLGPPEVEARREALLRQMIANPADLDLAFEYAQFSSQVGDYEGAIHTAIAWSGQTSGQTDRDHSRLCEALVCVPQGTQIRGPAGAPVASFCPASVSSSPAER